MARVGLVLSGGMAKGAYQVGALRAMSEFFDVDEVRYISAASVGAINAISYSAGMMDTAVKVWRGFNARDKKVFLSSIYKSELLQRTLDRLAAARPVCEKLYVPLLHLAKRDLIYWDLLGEEESMRRQLLSAGIAFPVVTKPVKIGSRVFYDGALVDNIPVSPLVGLDTDYVVCMYFDKYHYSFESEFYDRKIIKINFDDDETFLSESFWFTRENTDKMMRSGYEKAKNIFEFVMRDGKDPEAVYARIKSVNALHSTKEFRITGDVVINNLNKLTKRFARRTLEE